LIQLSTWAISESEWRSTSLLLYDALNVKNLATTF